MTVRKFRQEEVQGIKKVGHVMPTPQGERFIDHIIQFKNGAVVAYGDASRDGFVWVIEARR